MRNLTLRFVSAACVFAMATLVAKPAGAQELQFTGSGNWGPTASITPYSAPDETWSFSFFLPNPIAADPTTEAVDFSYYLDGVAVSSPLQSVQFYKASDNGLFDLQFADHFVTFFGQDVGSTLTLVPGTYPASLSIDDAITTTGYGNVTIAAVPEPATWLMLGLGGAALLVYARKRRADGGAVGAMPA